MIDPNAIKGVTAAISNVIKDKGVHVPDDAIEKFKNFGNAVKNKTVTYDLIDEISKLCKSLRREINERRKNHRASVRRQKKVSAARKANKLKQAK